MTLIGAEDYFLQLAVLLSLVWFGFWSETHPIACKIPGVVWILILGVALSNTGILPFESDLYGVIFGYILPLAVPLLLYKATLTKILKESGMVLPIFLIGSVAVFIAALLGYYILDLGELGPKVAATYTAAWVGGMVNLVALSELTQMSPSEFSVVVSASAPVSIIGLSTLAILPQIPFIRRHFSSKIMDEQAEDKNMPSMQAEHVSFKLTHVAGALALSAIICVVSEMITDYFDLGNYLLFLITIIAVLLANIFSASLNKLKGDFEFGMFGMYLFFAAIGASTDAITFVTKAPIFFLYGLIIIFGHIGLMLLVAKIFKFDLAETIIGSGANIVGAAPAAGIASAKGWKNLVTPAIATGMLGYAIGNFFGLGMFKLLG
ncbi:MAG: DUF819 family protein [Parasphingorhabdus sp.]